MSTLPAHRVGPGGLMDLEWSDLFVLLAICRAGSLAGAARTLGNNHSTVFRRLKAIEDKTGVRFFERLPEGYAMTDAGRTALVYAERIETEMHALSREVLGQDLRLQGKIRVTAPEGLTTEIAPKLLAQFMRKHPDVTIDIVGFSAAADLSRREADIAIRATAKPPDSSVGRRVCDFRFAIYGSAELVESHADVPLADQSWCFLTGIVSWLIPTVWKKRSHGESRTVFTSGNVFAVINAAAQGLGLTALPCYLGDADTRLVRVGEPIESLTLQLWLLTHQDLRHTARVKALLAFLHEELKARRSLFEGNSR